jgi:hypothetical protein
VSKESEENIRLVTCRCQICNGAIEFDANELQGMESATVDCPHCHMETIIFAPRTPPARPVQTNPAAQAKTGPVLYQVMRSMVIAWSIVCILGLGGCVATTLTTTTTSTVPEGSNPETYHGGFFLIGIIMSVLWWAVVWVLVAVPCATIYVVSKKKE